MAKKFRFRLEAVRKVRAQERDVHRRAVADAVRAASRVEARLAQLSDELRATLNLQRGARRMVLADVVVLRGQQTYRNELHRRIGEALQELTQRRRDVDARRAELAEVSKRVKVIEKLRDKQWTRHRVEVQREAQMDSDETAVQRYLRACRAATGDTA